MSLLSTDFRRFIGLLFPKGKKGSFSFAPRPCRLTQGRGQGGGRGTVGRPGWQDRTGERQRRCTGAGRGKRPVQTGGGQTPLSPSVRAAGKRPVRAAARGGERARGRAAKAREGHTGRGHAEDGGRETEAAGTAVRNSANRTAHRGESGKPRGPCGTERPHRVCADEGTARGSGGTDCGKGALEDSRTVKKRTGPRARSWGRPPAKAERDKRARTVIQKGRGYWWKGRREGVGACRGGRRGSRGRCPGPKGGPPQGKARGMARPSKGGEGGASGAKERGPPTLPASAKAPSLFLYFPFSGTRTGPPPPWPGAWPAAAAGGLR